MIHVSYGPPGSQGVQTIMGLGADELAALSDKTDAALTKAGWISVGVWAVGVVLNKSRLRDMGIGGALASFIVRHATK
jgi:hypothetical protein